VAFVAPNVPVSGVDADTDLWLDHAEHARSPRSPSEAQRVSWVQRSLQERKLCTSPLDDLPHARGVEPRYGGDDRGGGVKDAALGVRCGLPRWFNHLMRKRNLSARCQVEFFLGFLRIGGWYAPLRSRSTRQRFPQSGQRNTIPLAVRVSMTATVSLHAGHTMPVRIGSRMRFTSRYTGPHNTQTTTGRKRLSVKPEIPYLLCQ
jgi:hypothetical protein